MSAGKRLAIGGFVVFAVTAYMAYVGGASSWKYYVTADECARDASSLAGKRVRVSGQVEPGTLQIAPDRSQARFSLAGTQDLLGVICRCQIPDNLAEGVDVVVEGQLGPDSQLVGEKLLTRCASKYESEPASVARTASSETRARQTR
jgi:cytochrome c-type biogenesis protein CcmE